MTISILYSNRKKKSSRKLKFSFLTPRFHFSKIYLSGSLGCPDERSKIGQDSDQPNRFNLIDSPKRSNSELMY